MTEKNKKDYSKGKIYKIEPIIEHDEGDIYIGSTCHDKLSQRMAKHRSQYNYWKKGNVIPKLMSFEIFDKYDLKNCCIVLIEEVKANAIDELLAREKHYIKSFKCLNKKIPLNTDKEYYEENKSTILQKIRNYRKNNRVKINEQKKQYYEKNKINESEYKKQKYHCECGSICRIHEKLRHFRSKKHIKFIESKNNV